eukprot:SAG25_NODE_213_length_11711_cov_8.330348_13_plen_105_part_00
MINPIIFTRTPTQVRHEMVLPAVAAARSPAGALVAVYEGGSLLWRLPDVEAHHLAQGVHGAAPIPLGVLALHHEPHEGQHMLASTMLGSGQFYFASHYGDIKYR